MATQTFAPTTPDAAADGKLWRVWLLLVAADFALLGALMLAAPSLTQPLFNTLFFGQASPPATFSPEALAYIRFSHGILGAVLIGWMVLVAYVIAVPFRRGEAWAWNALAGSFGLWFLIDSAFSIWAGFAANVALNALITVAAFIPLAMSYRRCKG